MTNPYTAGELLSEAADSCGIEVVVATVSTPDGRTIYEARISDFVWGTGNTPNDAIDSLREALVTVIKGSLLEGPNALAVSSVGDTSAET
jgi:hypothetical protein